MNKQNLLNRAIEIVNSNAVVGFTSTMLKKAANTDINNFLIYLESISEQAWDPSTEELTIKTYSKELVEIAKELFPKKDDYPLVNLDESKIKGGKADKLSLKDIAKKFKIEISTLEKELKMGQNVELEHTKDITAAKDIAMDHLSEIPDYYTRLKKMEKEGNKKWVDETKILIKKLVRESLIKI